MAKFPLKLHHLEDQTCQKCSNFDGKCVSQICSLVGKPNFLYILKINYVHETHQILCLAKTENLVCLESGYNKMLTV